jgi:hypothetical protein
MAFAFAIAWIARRPGFPMVFFDPGYANRFSGVYSEPIGKDRKPVRGPRFGGCESAADPVRDATIL